MLISQRQAFNILRAQTGLSVAACKEKIAAAPKVADGKRSKLRSADLGRIVRETNAPPAVRDIGVRPVSAKSIAKLRESRI